jgi:hypothetical protein
MRQRADMYRRWILANSWSEALGLGTTFVLAGVLVPHLDQLDSVAAALLGVSGAVLHGILLEGVLVGFAQARVMSVGFPGLSQRAWVVATAVGAGVAWLVGMVPSTVIGLVESEAPGAAPPFEPHPVVVYFGAAALGAVTGPILAVAQWTVLRRHVRRAHRWLLANAVAWSAGMALIFVGMDRVVPWGGTPMAIGLALYAVCGVTGAIVGMIHGRWLLRFAADRLQS